ncbi:MAG: hypothetical protein ACFFAE_21750 [Candidatus Hodarchaeota archaeon]
MNTIQKFSNIVILLIFGFSLLALILNFFPVYTQYFQSKSYSDNITPMVGNPKSQQEKLSNIRSHIHPIIGENPPVTWRITQDQEFEEWKLFWALNVDTMDHYQINATLRAVGSHCLIYSDLSLGLNPTFLEINHSFETVIYPTLYKFYGSPPDLDDNNRVIILIYDIIDGLGGGQYIAGFFYPLNQYLNEDLHSSQQFSNEAEILYIDGNEGLTLLTAGNFETLAHEFQHMIHFGHDDDENTWLDEGASMFAEYLIGRDPFSGSSSYKSQFSSHPDVSLTYWDYYNSENLVLANYGASYAFFRYLTEKYGNNSLFQEIIKKPENGITSIEQALAAMGYPNEFKEVFRNWTIANFMNNISLVNGAYGYKNLTLIMNIENSYDSLVIPRTDNSVPFWGTDYLEFNWSIDSPFNFEFHSDGTSGFLVTVILTNVTTHPFNSLVIPLEIPDTGSESFSSESIGVSADLIDIVISAYPLSGTPNFNNTEPAPLQSYWFIVNPNKVSITSGDLSLESYGEILNIQNVTVTDNTGFLWQSADGAIYEIFTELGEPTGITGFFEYNSFLESWESSAINLTLLSAGPYKVRYYFFNATFSGTTYSETFVKIEIVIFLGVLEFSENGQLLLLWNVTVQDSSGYFWQEADVATYEVIESSTGTTAITGSLFYDSTTNYWESGLIDLSSLPEGEYLIKYLFQNNSVGNYSFSQVFTISKEPITSEYLSSSTGSIPYSPPSSVSPQTISNSRSTTESSGSLPSSSITSSSGIFFLIGLILMGIYLKRQN